MDEKVYNNTTNKGLIVDSGLGNNNSLEKAIDKTKYGADEVINKGEKLEWSNGIGSRERRSFLIFIKNGEIILFNGKSIKGVCVVYGEDYKKNGKFSHSTYRIQTGKGILSIPFSSGWNTGTFREGISSAINGGHLDRWNDLSEALNISIDSLKKFLHSFKPKEAKLLDEIDNDLKLLEEGEEEKQKTEIIYFGSPNNSSISEGYWERPKKITNYDAEIRLIDVEKGWEKENIEIVGISGIVISVIHSRGMHGGHYTVSVSVIPGTEYKIDKFETRLEKAAHKSDLPEDLFFEFYGNEAKINQFMTNVENLDITKLDEHEMICGRARKEAEVIRVSGNSDFFLGSDPLRVCDYIMGNSSEKEIKVTNNKNNKEPEKTALELALIKAGF